MAQVIQFLEAKARLMRKQYASERRQLPEGLPLFIPEQRYAILMNASAHESRNYKWNLDNSLTSGIYQMELALSGSCNVPKNFQNKIAVYFEDVIDYYKGLGRNIAYDAVFRIFPERYKKEGKGMKYLPVSSLEYQLNKALFAISAEATQEALTFFYLQASHSTPEGFQCGRYFLDYTAILSKLDRIPGKKVLASIASHSGALLDLLEYWPKKEEYIALSLTQADEEANLLASDSICLSLVDLILHAEPLSSLNLYPNPYRQQRTPQITGRFDVIL